MTKETLKCCETFFEVVENVVNVFESDRKSYHAAVDSARNKLLVCELTVCCTCRVEYTGADISNVYLVGSK